MRTRSDLGAGALLGAAAGDQLAATTDSPEDGALYGWYTQSMTLASYEILEHSDVDPERLATRLRGFAESDDGNLFRAQPDGFLETPSDIEVAARAVPVGLWWRQDPDGLQHAAVRAARATSEDTHHHLIAAAYAGAVAAASYGQLGLDYLNGVAELARQAEDRFVNGSRELSGWLSSTQALLDEPVGYVVGVSEEAGVPLPVLAIALGAAPWDASHEVVEETAASGSAALAALVGGIAGSRWGIGTWPWFVPNASWFAEIGRRLCTRQPSTADLPQPGAVEAFLVLEGPDAV